MIPDWLVADHEDLRRSLPPDLARGDASYSAVVFLLDELWDREALEQSLGELFGITPEQVAADVAAADPDPATRLHARELLGGPPMPRHRDR